MNRWWEVDATERFWLEATDRHDIGADLRAPLLDDGGKDNWRYTLFRTARIGDVVLHYHKGEDVQGIIGFSIIAGISEDIEIVWAARGRYSIAKDADPRPRPGYRIPLRGLYRFTKPLTLEELRSHRDDIADVVATQEKVSAPPLYFPFELSSKRELRLLQGYAFKLPKLFLSTFVELNMAIAAADEATIGDAVFPLEALEKIARNPSWSRDELILALDLYLKHRASPPGKNSVEVDELSKFLNAMGQALGVGDKATYRNPNGVYMKMMNFRRFDPDYTDSGKVGLTRGNKEEEFIWADFSNDLPRLAQVVNAIRQAVTDHSNDSELSQADDPDFHEAEEGRVLTRLHRYRERSRKLVEKFKAAELKKHSRLECAACKFDFSEKYGKAGNGIIDVHHTKPVHTLAEGDKTNLADLVLLCPNCHRMVHSSKRWLTVSQVSDLINKDC